MSAETIRERLAAAKASRERLQKVPFGDPVYAAGGEAWQLQDWSVTNAEDALYGAAPTDLELLLAVAEAAWPVVLEPGNRGRVKAGRLLQALAALQDGS